MSYLTPKLFVFKDKAYRGLHLAFGEGATYHDAIVCWPEGIIGRTLQRFFYWLPKAISWTAKYDSESLDIKQGDVFPMFSGTYWLIWPQRLSNRYFPRVSGYELREKYGF